LNTRQIGTKLILLIMEGQGKATPAEKTLQLYEKIWPRILHFCILLIFHQYFRMP